jgi:hypothetical protein
MSNPFRTALVVILLLQVISVVAYADNKLTPQVTGTISSYPNQPLVIAPVGSAIQSVSTTIFISHGILEFVIPSLPGPVTQATLVLREDRGTSGAPMPPVTHLISAYEGDLLLDVGDYDRPAVPLLTFESDSNDPPSIISLDITAAVQSYEGRVLGLRIEPIISALNDGDAFFGLLSFPGWKQYAPVIEVRRGLRTDN